MAVGAGVVQPSGKQQLFTYLFTETSINMHGNKQPTQTQTYFYFSHSQQIGKWIDLTLTFEKQFLNKSINPKSICMCNVQLKKVK